MADAVPQIVWITDAQGRVEFFNRQWVAYTGIQHLPETASEVANAAVHPDDIAETMARFSAAIDTQTTFYAEHRIRSASGEYRWFMARAEPEFDAETGALVRWLGASVDIHDRVEAEQRLQQVAADQALQINLSLAIGQLESPGDITSVALGMLGAHLGAIRVICADIVGANSALIRRDWSALPEASLAGVVLTMSDFGPVMIDDLRAGHVVVNHDVTTDERTASHSAAFIERGVRAELVVPVLRDGQLKLLVAIHMATAHQWQATEIGVAQAVGQQILLAAETTLAQGALRAERDLSRAILEGMHEGLVILDDEWNIVEINEVGAELAQRTRAELVGRNHWAAFPEVVGSEVERSYMRVRVTGVPETLEYIHEPVGGIPRWQELRAFPIVNGQIAVFFRDISERKRSEQELSEAVVRRDEFLAMLAHELRNPLAPIRAAADVLAAAVLREDTVRNTSAVISRQVSHMTELVDDLLDVSRVMRGLTVLETENANLKRIVADAVEQVGPLVESRGHHLTVQLPPGHAYVRGDSKRLVQVVANLLNNAAKYTPKGGHIDLSMEIEAQRVCLVVSDDGIGMSPQMVKRAFQLFYQAERTPDRAQGGLGIGLSLVKSLVELHGGSVEAQSAGEGAGSRFTVCLPRLAERAGPDAAARSPISPRSSNLRILVVDDNEDAASMLALYLETLGHTVMTEYSARAGLARALAEPPDICLLDIGLPDTDGNELARQLRSHPQTQTSTLIAVTGYGRESDRSDTAAAGFDHHLVKPVDPTVLADILERSSSQ
ncbi:ATP-binding protein [Lysobacter korlensis]|uniref:histidine kinase n=1 Tax=Lysobacter korlensis TaxID=553636 RepID=A0ABV6S393_9GAMM